MWQTIVVALAVASATLYLAWRWMPAAWRHRLQRLRSGDDSVVQAPGNASSGCGGCSGCGSGCSTVSSRPAPRSPR